MPAQIADTTKAVADCHAGLSDEPVSSSPDQFLDSLLSQLAALKEELASVFVDGGPERIERELALARRAAARVQKGSRLLSLLYRKINFRLRCDASMSLV